jgi:hypothetical protein
MNAHNANFAAGEQPSQPIEIAQENVPDWFTQSDEDDACATVDEWNSSSEHTSFAFITDEAELQVREITAPAEIKRAREIARAPSWEHPDLTLLGTGRSPSPKFPTHCLGTFFDQWCHHAAEGAAAPVDFVAGSTLAAAGGVAGNARWGKAGSEWAEPSVLWMSLCGDPSVSKTPGMRPVRHLIEHLEARQQAGFGDVWRAYETKAKAAAEICKIWDAELAKAVKAGQTPPDKPEAAEEPVKPAFPRISMCDATIEAIQEVAAGRPNALLALRDELAGWLGSMDRYRGNSGGGGDKPFWLEAWNGARYAVDRKSAGEKGKARKPVIIQNLSVGVLGGIQPDRLKELLNDADDGLVHRFLYCWPDDTADFKIKRDGGSQEARDFDHRARTAFERLSELEMVKDGDELKPKIVEFTPGAVDALEAFGQDMQRKARRNAATPMGATYSKARGRVLRLATVLQFLWWSADLLAGEPEAISADAVNAAIELMNTYFLPQAERIFREVSLPQAQQDAMLVLRRLRDDGERHFNARDLRRSMGTPFREPKRPGELSRMDAACEVLVEAGLLRADFSRAGNSPGQQTKDYLVNPVVLANHDD